MLELGQPLHAFDFARLSGRIVVRRAQAGETLELLDGNTLALQPDALLIADANGPVALAGIMGGEQSAVCATTRDIFLESAFFAPLPMAGKARQVGMQTDASQRFERGVDFRLQAVAIERATRLLLGITGGTPGPVVVACAEEHLPRLEPVQLRASRLDRLLGVTVPAPEVEDILRRLGLGVTREADGWRVTPTSWRFDLRIEADLVEEVGRVYGYEHIPARVQPHAMPIRARPETRLDLHDMRRRLIALGYQEAITYSFVEPRLQALLDPGVEPVAVANPISADMAVMRTTLWTGLLKTVQHNQHRQQRRVRVFETGLRFLPTAEGLQQRLAIAAVASGERLPENWTSDGGPLDFYDLRGDVEALLDGGQGMARLTVAPAVNPALHPGQSAVLRVDGQDAGWLGALHPQLEAALDLQGPVYLFEFDVEMISRKNLPSFKALSKFPEVRRDIAVLVDCTMPADTVLETARSAAGTLLVDLKLFDVYRGQGIDENQKSLALGVVLQDRERTLTDAEVGAVVDGIVAALAAHCGAIPRV
jgi:phenylalanyl-tRNA synthetase beta chain